jgi:hypothetical protein
MREQAFTTAWGQGRSMTIDQALAMPEQVAFVVTITVVRPTTAT